MTRSTRFLSVVNPTSVTSPSNTEVAEPPEAVAVESDFVVILAALLCALICVVGLIAVARCACLRRGPAGGGGGGGGGGRSSAPNKGLKKKILQSLPKFTYDSAAGAKVQGAATECAICLAEYVDGDEIRILPQCGHGFHVACIDTWLGSHSSCPSCRQILVLARCRKCGDYPAVSCGAAGARSEVKAGEDSCASTSNL